ncbi:MAG TPA: CBS domain-containing protein [Burkholderiales bacterium]|jgi:CBS domain-containing protein|nr:CBS domain-containing protein [Burkholderiales bacterium]
MSLDYAALPLRPLAPGARIRTATPHGGERLTLDSRALRVLTDFAVVPAATVEPGMPIREANEYMIRRGVRSLLVVDPLGRMVGIVTANDILGERPIQAALERNVPSTELAVREVMTPPDRMEALPLESLLDARIGHVVATLKRAGRQHALVVERSSEGDLVRGIFSLSQIASELGITIEFAGAASTFAEIEQALAR